MAEYIIGFNDEWVRDHEPDELRAKSAASRAVLEEMKAAGVYRYANGGIDAGTVVGVALAPEGRLEARPGLFRERDEYLGGFTVVDVPDDETAMYWARRLAEVLEWPQEVHRFPGS